MDSRRWILGMTAAAALAWTAGTQAQGVGLQVADTAEMRTTGESEFTIGTVFGDSMSGCGGRATYSFTDELRGFFDLGWYDPDSGDGNVAVQAGAIYSLPVEFLSDLGLRAAGYYVDTELLDIMGGSLMLISSGETLLDDLYAYGGAGVDVSDRSVQVTRTTSSGRTEVNPALTAGLSYRITSHFSAYVEASHVDAPMVGFGVRYR